MIKVGVVGATGYTGLELLRLLARHPSTRLQVVTSRSEAGIPVADVFPGLRGRIELRYADPRDAALDGCDVVFFAAPNGTAMEAAPDLLRQGVRVIDLAADFRLKDASAWEHWYGMPHKCPELLAEAVYGLPEINRDKITKARLIANPGCYPTAVTLGFLPLVESGAVEPASLIADAKSGVSGAGRKAGLGVSFCETADNFKAYNASRHRHLPEIAQILSTVGGGQIGLTFVPHLLPVIRGIHATLYARLVGGWRAQSDETLQNLFVDRYNDESFVEVCPFGSHPDTRSVRGANLCRISLHRPMQGETLVVLSVIDNLMKGAAGQAIQNMNLMFGLNETVGLETIALAP